MEKTHQRFIQTFNFLFNFNNTASKYIKSMYKCSLCIICSSHPLLRSVYYFDTQSTLQTGGEFVHYFMCLDRFVSVVDCVMLLCFTSSSGASYFGFAFSSTTLQKYPTLAPADRGKPNDPKENEQFLMSGNNNKRKNNL